MDKPVSNSTAPAEPSPSPEQIVESGPWGVYSDENEQFRMESGRIDAIVSASNRMAKDAARYRWLRFYPLDVRAYNRCYDGTLELKERDELDAAIDAAMKG